MQEPYEGHMGERPAALGNESTEDQPATGNHSKRREVPTMKKLIEAAGIGAARLGGPLLGSGTANADGLLTEYERSAVGHSYYATCGMFDEMFTGAVMHDAAVGAGVAQAVAGKYTARNGSDPTFKRAV